MYLLITAATMLQALKCYKMPFYTNHRSVSCGFQDKLHFPSTMVNFPCQPMYLSLLKGFPWESCNGGRDERTTVMIGPGGGKSFICAIQYWHWMDRHCFCMLMHTDTR